MRFFPTLNTGGEAPTTEFEYKAQGGVGGGRQAVAVALNQVWGSETEMQLLPTTCSLLPLTPSPYHSTIMAYPQSILAWAMEHMVAPA